MAMTEPGSLEIFVSVNVDERQAARLREAAAGDTVHLEHAFADPAVRRACFERCGVAFGNPPAGWVASSPNLKWLQLESVGFGEYAGLGPMAGARRPVVTNLAGFFAEPVAESALAGILALYRGIDRLVRLQDEFRWLGDRLRGELRLLSGARVVLFGFGTINRRLHALLAAFDCQIVPFSSRWRREDLYQALAAADIVVCTVPHTPSTRGLFGRDRLGLLKPSALLVNFGRGSLVDEEALADALVEGRLGGAVIDVTVSEPLPTGHRLWSCPHTIVTQHSGGGTMDETDRKIGLFLDNLARFRRHERLEGMVDFNRGY